MEKSSVTVNKRSPTIRRILREAAEIQKSPSRDFTARPLEQDIFVWHFTLRGPPAPSPFANGFYHGRILLSANYPLRPPMFRFLTPSGRFEVNRDICLSMSGFHEETWQPAWGIRTALVALRAFMDTDSEGQVGGMDSDEKMRKQLAEESRSWRCSECGGGGEEQEMLQAAMDDTLEKEVTIPEELKLGYKDQLKGKQEGGTEGQASSAGDVSGNPAEPGAAASSSLSEQTGQQPPVTSAPEIPPPPPFPENQALHLNPVPFSNIPDLHQQQQQQQPLDPHQLQQQYQQLLQQYQAALYPAHIYGHPSLQQGEVTNGLQDGNPPFEAGQATQDAQEQQDQQVQQPVQLAHAPRAAQAPPIHDFLHPNQDQGTAVIDIAIGIILGLIGLLYFSKFTTPVIF